MLATLATATATKIQQRVSPRQASDMRKMHNLVVRCAYCGLHRNAHEAHIAVGMNGLAFCTMQHVRYYALAQRFADAMTLHATHRLLMRRLTDEQHKKLAAMQVPLSDHDYVALAELFGEHVLYLNVVFVSVLRNAIAKVDITADRCTTWTLRDLDNRKDIDRVHGADAAHVRGPCHYFELCCMHAMEHTQRFAVAAVVEFCGAAFCS